MKKITCLLAVLLAVTALLSGCRKHSGADDGTPVWQLLGGRMENFAETYDSQTIIALEYFNESEERTTYAVTDPEAIDAIFQALNDIRVGEKTDEYAGGSGESFIFVTDARERYAVRFIQRHLDTSGDLYLIKNDGALWQLADNILEAAREQEEAAASHPTVEEHQEDLLPPPDPAPLPETPETADEEDSAEDTEYEAFRSEAQNFSILYDPALRAEELQDGSLRVYASDRDDISYVEVRRIAGEQSAVEYLEDQLAQLQANTDGVMMHSHSAEQVETSGFALYQIWLNYMTGDEFVSMVVYAEDIGDSVMSYTACFLENTAARTLDALEEAIVSVEYDEVSRWDLVTVPLPDGGVEYRVDTLQLDIPAGWEGKYFTKISGDYVLFFHTASYDRWMEDYGVESGLLFSLGYADDFDYITQLPAFQYLGPSNDGGHYFLTFPTDVQGFYEDDDVMAEYNALYDGIDYVTRNSYTLSPN